MTNSYLDEEWMDSQARELTTLQQKLREHLDIITLAAGQLPDLVLQIGRLEQRERETHQAIEDGRMLSLRQLTTAQAEGIRLLGAHALDLGDRFEQRLTQSGDKQEEALEALTSRALETLEAQHEALKGRLDEHAVERYGNLPPRVQAIEDLMDTLRQDLASDVDRRVQKLEGSVGTHLNSLQSSLEADAEQVTARLEPLERGHTETGTALASLGTVLESQATHQNQALEILEQTQSELRTQVGSLREELNHRAEQLEAQLNQERAETGTQLTTLEHHVTQHSDTLANIQETQGLTGTYLVSLQDELNQQAEQTEGRLSQLQEATSKQLMTLEGRVAQQGETLGTLQYTQGGMGTQLSSLQDALGQSRMEVAAQLSALEQGQADIGADVATLRLTLTGQAKRQGEVLDTLQEDQMSLGRSITLQDAALTQHAHQVSSQIKDGHTATEKQLAELQTTLERQANQQARTVADLRRSQDEALGQLREQISALEKQLREQAAETDRAQEAGTREVSELRTQVLSVSNRLSGFVDWFRTSGAWKRLNGDPDA